MLILKIIFNFWQLDILGAALFDYITASSRADSNLGPRGPVKSVTGGSPGFWIAKRLFDVCLSLLLLPLLMLFSLILVLLNPFWNRGALFYTQIRMGRDCVPFAAIKFRTMRPLSGGKRGYNDPIEDDRITMLGRAMRKSRIDELPQIINVLKGDMSLIGPRPDCYEHAIEYLRIIPDYRARHIVRPGISGLAQITVGYVENVDGTARKVAADLSYIADAGFRLEARLFVGTLRTIVTCVGA